MTSSEGLGMSSTSVSWSGEEKNQVLAKGWLRINFDNFPTGLDNWGNCEVACGEVSSSNWGNSIKTFVAKNVDAVNHAPNTSGQVLIQLIVIIRLCYHGSVTSDTRCPRLDSKSANFVIPIPIPENTHRWGKHHCMAGLQFNKTGTDQWRKYNFICI